MPRVDRTMALYGYVLASAGAMFVLLFWTIAFVNLSTGTGFIADLGLDGLWRTGFFSYPFVTFLAIAGGAAAYFMGRYEAAVGMAGLPIAGLILYYLALVQLS